MGILGPAGTEPLVRKVIGDSSFPLLGQKGNSERLNKETDKRLVVDHVKLGSTLVDSTKYT